MTWGAVSGATNYTVFWQVGSGVTTLSSTLAPTSTTDYGHSGVVPGAQYCYRVRASNSYGDSGLSNELCVTVPCAAPAAPTLLGAIYQSTSRWNYVTWSASSGATSYLVRWKVGPGVTTSSSTLAPTVTTDYGHSGVVSGSQYCYRVSVTTVCGTSGLSNELCATVP